MERKSKRKRRQFPGASLYRLLSMPVEFSFPTALTPDQWEDAVHHIKLTGCDNRSGSSVDVKSYDLSYERAVLNLRFRRRSQQNRYRTTARARVQIYYEPNLGGSFVSGTGVPSLYPPVMFLMLLGFELHALFFAFAWWNSALMLLWIIFYGAIGLLMVMNFRQMFLDRDSLVKVIRYELKI